MMRQISKQILTILAFLAALAALPARADQLTPSIVTDPLTGVAIEGYDPVTYFTDPEPQRGSPDYEFYWQGVPWYFANAANRDIFKLAPEIYAPQHGGHCEMSLARGFLSDGKPRIYALHQMKLYLFYSAANREAFLLSQREAVATANANWPKLAYDAFGLVVAAAPEADVAAGEDDHHAEAEAPHGDAGGAVEPAHEAEPEPEHHAEPEHHPEAEHAPDPEHPAAAVH